MKRTFIEAISQAIRLVVVLFVVLFGAVSCTDEHFVGGEEPEINKPDETPVAGDTIVSFNGFKLVEDDWSYSNGLAAADHYFDGYVEYKVNDEVVKTDLIDHENAPMRISWTPIEETTSASAEKMYFGFKAEKAEPKDTLTNQKVNFIKYERECKLSFVGMEVTLTGSWYEASLGSSNVVACRYDSTTVATQVQDTAMIDGVKEEVEVDGKKYYRVNVIAKAENHFTDMPAKTAHVEPMDINYSVLVPVIFVPGDKIYEGSIAGSGSYVKASEESYRSELNLTHIFTQDGAQIKEQETVSGLATVRTWVEGDNNPKIWSSSQIGNPSVSVNTSISENYYQKEGNIYAKMYKTVWTYTWTDANTGESFRKEVHSEVERLYYMRETEKAVAMPFGETSSSYAGFNAGAAVIKTQNNKEYEAYSGQISFNGNHKSTTGNVNDAIEGLKAAQEIWVEVVKEEDKFIDYDYKVIKGDKDKAAQIIITEHWSVSGNKPVTFTQNANYSFTVSEQQRVFAESLNFANGPTKSTDDPRYNEVKENQFVRTVTTTTSVNFIPTCEVKATAKVNEAYIMYRGEKIYFEFAEATVSFNKDNILAPKATEVTVDGKLYSRLAYEIPFTHSVLGTKSASVLVDKEIVLDPSTPSEWGTLDIEKTKNFGGICISWEKVGNTFKPFYSGTVITSKGIVSFKNGYQKFTAMNTNSINNKVGNAWDGANLYPAYIIVDKSAANPSWAYYDVTTGTLLTDVHSSKMEVEGGFDMEQPFVANGGQANVYEISENGNVVRVVVTFNGETMFNEVFAK